MLQAEKTLHGDYKVFFRGDRQKNTLFHIYKKNGVYENDRFPQGRFYKTIKESLEYFAGFEVLKEEYERYYLRRDLDLIISNDSFRYECEKIGRKYWHTVIEKSTGNARIMIGKKDLFSDMSLEQIISFMEKMKVPVTESMFKKES